MKKAKDLQKGDLFKFDGQRKFRVFEKSTILENSPIIHHRGKLLIMTNECKNFLVNPDDLVKIEK